MAELIIDKHVSLSYTLWRFFSVSLSRAARSHPAGLALHHVGLTAVNLSDGRGWPLAQGLGAMGAMGAKAPESWRFSLRPFTWKKCGSFRKLKGLLCQKNMLSRADLTITPRLLGSRHCCSSSCAFPHISPHFRGVLVIFPKKAMAIWCFTVQPWSDGFCTHQITCHSWECGDQPWWSLQICKSLPFVNQTTGKTPLDMGVVVAKSSIDSIFPG